MDSLKFYIVDVFAVDKYTGNQLVVFPHADSLDDRQMQQIAREINFSETTFVGDPESKGASYPVRIFTPTKELPFAGHPTLGTAFVLQQELIKQSIHRLDLKMQAGLIPVNFHYRGDRLDNLWMEQRPPAFYETFTADQLAEVLGVKPGDIDDRFPVQSVSTGVAFIIVPLKDLSAVKACRINQAAYWELVNTASAKQIMVFCPQTLQSQNHLHVRMFADYLGIPEDAATGSGNGCLAAYLVQYQYLGTEDIDLRVEQGYEIGRPSLLLIRAKRNQAVIEVAVGGRVVMIARGEFL